MTSRRLRRFVFAFTLAVLTFAGAAPAAQAQWVVTDPSNIASMIKQFLQLQEQIRTAHDQLTNMEKNLRRLASPEGWDAQAWLLDLDRAHRSLNALSYTASDIDQQMADIFGTDPYLPDDYLADRHEQIERVLLTMRTTVSAMNQHRKQIQEARSTIDALKAQSEAASGNLEAIQAQTGAALFAVESTEMLREQISALTTMIAVQNAQRLSEDRREQATMDRAREGAVMSDTPAFSSY